MSVAQFIPSPLAGEGYEALSPQAARRSWMRGTTVAFARAVDTPHPASTRRWSRQVFATLSRKGRGEGVAFR